MRLPIGLYRMRLGWLLTPHFLRLTTTGRISGVPRYAVVEVVKHDRSTGAVVIASGWGPKADWYRNILKTPRVFVDVGFRHYDAVAVPLGDDQAACLLMEYAARFPLPFWIISRLLAGEWLRGTPEECAKLAKSFPLVALNPLK